MSIPRYLSIFADFLSSAGILSTSGGGTGLTTTPSNGQVDIGNGGGFTRTTLTPGPGVTINNGAGAITISAGSTQLSTSISSGTYSVSLAGIPATAKRVVVTFNGVSQGSAAPILLQLGTSSGLISTASYYGGAASGASYTAYSTGVGFFATYPSTPIDGTITLINIGSNAWICNGIVGTGGSVGYTNTAIGLSAALTQIGLVTNGVNTFTGSSGVLTLLYD